MSIITWFFSVYFFLVNTEVEHLFILFILYEFSVNTLCKFSIQLPVHSYIICRGSLDILNFNLMSVRHFTVLILSYFFLFSFFLLFSYFYGVEYVKFPYIKINLSLPKKIIPLRIWFGLHWMYLRRTNTEILRFQSDQNAVSKGLILL